MKSFLTKRRKSLSSGEEPQPIESQNAPPLPSAALPALDKVQMPDLRFSRLDLDPIDFGAREVASSSSPIPKRESSGFLSPRLGSSPVPIRSSSQTNISNLTPASSPPLTFPRSATTTFPLSNNNDHSKDPYDGEASSPTSPTPVTPTSPFSTAPLNISPKKSSQKISSPSLVPLSPSALSKEVDISSPMSPQRAAPKPPTDGQRPSIDLPSKQDDNRKNRLKGSPSLEAGALRDTHRKSSFASEGAPLSPSASSFTNNRSRTSSMLKPKDQDQKSDRSRSNSRSHSPSLPSPKRELSESELRLAQLKLESEKGVRRAKEMKEYQKKKMEEWEKERQQEVKAKKNSKKQQQQQEEQQPQQERQHQPQPQQQQALSADSTSPPPISEKKENTLKKRLSSFGLRKKENKEEEKANKETKREKVAKTGRSSEAVNIPKSPSNVQQSLPGEKRQQQQPPSRKAKDPLRENGKGTMPSKKSSRSLKTEAEKSKSVKQQQQPQDPHQQKERLQQPMQKSSPVMEQQQKSPNGSILAPASPPKPKSPKDKDMGSFQFPPKRPQQAPRAPSRSQSAMTASDGVPRPVPSRGMTETEDKESRAIVPPSPVHCRPLDGTSHGTHQHDTTSSSEGPSSSEGATTTDGGASRSLDTNPSSTSWTPKVTDSPEGRSFKDFDENEEDVEAVQDRPRPRRDEEKRERTVSRLSMTMDQELEGSMGEQGHERSSSKGSKTRFSAALMGGVSRASSALDMRPDDEIAADGDGSRNVARSVVRTNTPPRRLRERARETVLPKRDPNPDMIVHGYGWKCNGVGDPDPVSTHDRWEKIKVQVPKSVTVQRKKERDGDFSNSEASGTLDSSQRRDRGVHEDDELEQQNSEEEEDYDDDEEYEEVVKVEYEEELQDIRFNDLFEVLWTSTTPDVAHRILSQLDFADIKALRQASSAVRFSVGAQREMVLEKYIGCVGYRPWKACTTRDGRGPSGRPITIAKDPCPLSFSDCEAFLLSHDLLPEYAAVAKEYSMAPSEMDPRLPRLARATTRAYNRVLTRLRLQPIFKVPSGAKRVEASAKITDDVNDGERHMARANSYYPTSPNRPDGRAGSMMPPASGSVMGLHGISAGAHSSPMDSSPRHSPNVSPAPENGVFGMPVAQTSPQIQQGMPVMPSPWKPGRAALFRVWVPAADPSGWLSDEELSRCEGEIYRSGVWNFLKRGDVIWDVAIGDSLNEGKFVFDGHYLRDLSYAYDVAGHLPSWLNTLVFPPSYWHNVLRSSTPKPFVYLDISPWKDQILSSLRLVQDHVESVSPQGRYRIAKWIYRAVTTITAGQIISRMDQGLEVVDEGWHGKIVIETEGTSEHAKALISRCAGPNATPQAKAALLASVMGDEAASAAVLPNADTQTAFWKAQHQQKQQQQQAIFMSNSSNNVSKENLNAPWIVLRERSRPGMIWLRPVGERERVAVG